MLVPTLVVRDITEASAFLTQVLDFKLVNVWPDASPFYAVLTRGQDEMHLTTSPGEMPRGRSTVIVICEDVDAAFASFKARGLRPPTRSHSPVHEAPLNQTWGTREVYIDDPSGNTLVFQQR